MFSPSQPGLYTARIIPCKSALTVIITIILFLAVVSKTLVVHGCMVCPCDVHALEMGGNNLRQ